MQRQPCPHCGYNDWAEFPKLELVNPNAEYVQGYGHAPVFRSFAVGYRCVSCGAVEGGNPEVIDLDPPPPDDEIEYDLDEELRTIAVKMLLTLLEQELSETARRVEKRHRTAIIVLWAAFGLAVLSLGITIVGFLFLLGAG